jgi:two-component system sensor histidine kinase KdpD
MADDELKRPSPDALLELAQKVEAQEKGGKLTIYFGSAPGVGKTYAMLSDARQRKLEGVEVVAGYVETHGRPETDVLLEGLETIPPLVVEYLGLQLKEIDLNKVLERKPQLVLVDEFAHTNAPGLRHTKRYQDVQEILNAGIDVYTTLNVQHIESLNDVIFRISNIRVHETVPDTVIEAADEVKLIDLPPEELLKRLEEGKVYVKDIAGVAVHEFFRPANLLALRQLALRLVAGSVDEKMRHYMQAHAIAGPWPVKERVLVGIFASPYAEKLVRAAFRLASQIDAECIAFHVETDRDNSLSKQERDWLNTALELARKLGVQVVWIKGSNVTQEIANYALNNNVTKIVIGKPRRFGIFPSVPRRLLLNTPNIDVYLMDAKDEAKPLPKKHLLHSRPTNYAISFLAVCLMSLIAFFLRGTLSQVNLLFLLFLPLILSALYLGRGPSIFAALVAVLIFDYLFVPPYFTLTISDLEYFLWFVVYVVVVLVISNLALKLRSKVEMLRQSESRSTTLYALSRDLVTVHTVEETLSMLVQHISQIFPCEMAIFLPVDGEPKVMAKTVKFDINPNVLGVASWVLLNKQSAGQGTGTLPEAKALFLPMMTTDHMVGVVGLLFEKPKQVITPENQVIMETIARLGAMAIERIKSPS